MMKLIVMFVIFAGVMYYFNIDLHGAIDRSGVPQWLAEHGVKTSKDATATVSLSGTSTATTTQN